MTAGHPVKARYTTAVIEDAMETIEIETGPEPRAAVIWLHGLGADGHDFEPIVPELDLPDSLQVRFVFPHAPVRPVTINQRMRMRAWYDIFQLGGGAEDEAGIRESQGFLDGLIAAEKAKGIAPGRIVIAGFSQGGAIALQAALRYPERLAGVLALSTYLPLAVSVEKERSMENRATPVFMAHGTYDDIIPLRRAEESRQILEKLGNPVEWHPYPMPHSVCPEEIADIAAFLGRTLA
jgi:phospholipase/carboxylesterase